MKRLRSDNSLTLLTLTAAAILWMPPMATAQRINIDLGNGPEGNNGDYTGTAASGQGGTWNHINSPMAANMQIPVLNADGTSTGVRFVALIATQVFDPGEGSELLVDADLMGDIHWNTPSTSGRYELRGVAPGQYNLFLYSYAGDVVNDDTVFTYAGQQLTVAHVGAGDPTSHAYLDTFAVYYPVVPDANGVIRFVVQAGPGVAGIDNFWQLNGLQLGIGDPFSLPPSLLFTQPNRGTDENGCVVLNWTLRNINPLAPISVWHMDLEAGAGGRNPACIGPDTVTVGDGWTATYCYPWDLGLGPSSPSSRAVIEFAGPALLPGAALNGTIRVDANGPVSFKEPLPPAVTLPYPPPDNHVVQPRGIHVHARQGSPNATCANGTFNAHTGQNTGWVTTVDVVCLPAFLAVNALDGLGRVALLGIVAIFGVRLLRPRSPAFACVSRR